MISIIDIRAKIQEDIFDYQQLNELLSIYNNPRDRISRLLKSGEIIRIRKGLYTFAEALRRGPVCRELLANLIYGPSYITADYALSYYGFIPERVETVTSVTIGRSRSFHTPLGTFSYRNYAEHLYSPGITIEPHGRLSFLIATPEKALIDKVWLDKRFKGRSKSSYRDYLTDDLRIDYNHLSEINPDRFKEISTAIKCKKIDALYAYLKSEGICK